MKTSLKRKKSVDLPNIHKIATRDHINPFGDFLGFYSFNSWPPSISDSHFQPPVTSLAPLIAPEPNLMTLRWLPRNTSPRLKMTRLRIFQQACAKARCPNHLYKNWRIWVFSKLTL